MDLCLRAPSAHPVAHSAHVIGIEPTTGVADVARELLFFALAITILALSDLSDMGAERRGHRGYESLRAGSIVVIAISAAH
jgi:hypothetical protein